MTPKSVSRAELGSSPTSSLGLADAVVAWATLCELRMPVVLAEPIPCSPVAGFKGGWRTYEQAIHVHHSEALVDSR